MEGQQEITPCLVAGGQHDAANAAKRLNLRIALQRLGGALERPLANPIFATLQRFSFCFIGRCGNSANKHPSGLSLPPSECFTLDIIINGMMIMKE